MIYSDVPSFSLYLSEKHFLQDIIKYWYYILFNSHITSNSCIIPLLFEIKAVSEFLLEENNRSITWFWDIQLKNIYVVHAKRNASGFPLITPLKTYPLPALSEFMIVCESGGCHICGWVLEWGDTPHTQVPQIFMSTKHLSCISQSPLIIYMLIETYQSCFSPSFQNRCSFIFTVSLLSKFSLFF